MDNIHIYRVSGMWGITHNGNYVRCFEESLDTVLNWISWQMTMHGKYQNCMVVISCISDDFIKDM